MRDGGNLLSQRIPRALSREGRVLLIHEAAVALLRDELPPAEARLFLAAALLSWLDRGGNLEKRYFRVAAQRGSHRTASALLRAHRDDGVFAAESIDSGLAINEGTES